MRHPVLLHQSEDIVDPARMVLQRRAKCLGFSLLSLRKVLLQLDKPLHVLNSLVLLILNAHELIKLLLHLSLLLTRLCDLLELHLQEGQIGLFVRPKVPMMSTLSLKTGRVHLSLL